MASSNFSQQKILKELANFLGIARSSGFGVR
jgi:hypothetical protein